MYFGLPTLLIPSTPDGNTINFAFTLSKTILLTAQLLILWITIFKYRQKGTVISYLFLLIPVVLILFNLPFFQTIDSQTANQYPFEVQTLKIENKELRFSLKPVNFPDEDVIYSLEYCAVPNDSYSSTALNAKYDCNERINYIKFENAKFYKSVGEYLYDNKFEQIEYLDGSFKLKMQNNPKFLRVLSITKKDFKDDGDVANVYFIPIVP